MAYNVFGDPVTNSTLEAMPEYEGKTITRFDRAHVALNLKNAGDKDINARKYVENLKEQWGTGVSTLCLVYNATGDSITLVKTHDWWGHIGQAPYPVTIANGQWGGFLHVKTSGAATGSTSAVVYRGANNKDEICEWMSSWSNPWNRSSSDNTVRENGHYSNQDHWDAIADTLYGSGLISSDEWNGCTSTATTGSGTTAVFESVLGLQGT